MPDRRPILPVAACLLLLTAACGADRITSVAQPQPALAVEPSQGRTGAMLRWRCGGGPLPDDVLAVIDGVMVGRGSDLARTDPVLVRPDEIASVEILKGPAAVARYGPGAGTGVVVIRTRRAAPDAVNPAPPTATNASPVERDAPAPAAGVGGAASPRVSPVRPVQGG